MTSSASGPTTGDALIGQQRQQLWIDRTPGGPGSGHPPDAVERIVQHPGIMAIGVRVEPELERQLVKSRSACVRDAITQYLLRQGDGEKARRQSQRLAEREPQQNWIEQLPDWSDWTA